MARVNGADSHRLSFRVAATRVAYAISTRIKAFPITPKN